MVRRARRSEDSSMHSCRKAVTDAIHFLRKSSGHPKILVKQIRNLGDTLHLTPVIRHYRLKFPGASIAFVTGQWYHNAHELNQHINGLFLADHNATPQQRLALWPLIHNATGVDIKIIASIFPFGEIYPRNRWNYETIADQYLYNAGVSDLKPMGGRRLEVKLSGEDVAFANRLVKKHGPLVVFEYHSYSREPAWQAKHFSQLATRLGQKGVRCVSVASANEGLIPGTVDCRGLTWRQTAAVLSVSKAMVGVGSGITMLAAAADPQPRIIELGIANSVSMKGCGYAPSICLNNPSVDVVRDLIIEVIK